jgi:hypothetical protein
MFSAGNRRTDSNRRHDHHATASTSFALAPVNHTGGKKMLGSMTGTNKTSGMMCTPQYPC